MGLFEKLRRNVPGGPTSIAKTMLNVYRSYLARDQGEKSDALRYCIESRYLTLKIMNQEEIETCLAEAHTFSDLVFACVAKENPAAVETAFLKNTVEDLYMFFKENAPEEISQSFQAMKDVVGIKYR